jgi:predicted Zn-dependent protease
VNDEANVVFLRAVGFLELGMPEDALSELGELPAEFQSSPVALHLRVDALFRLKEWTAAREICMAMLGEHPNDPGWWIQAAYATRRAESVAAAEPILRKAIESHPRHGLILYNLACYACVQGRHDEARSLLEQAEAGDKGTYLGMAANDADLVAIMPWITEQRAGAITKQIGQ